VLSSLLEFREGCPYLRQFAGRDRHMMTKNDAPSDALPLEASAALNAYLRKDEFIE